MVKAQQDGEQVCALFPQILYGARFVMAKTIDVGSDGISPG